MLGSGVNNASEKFMIFSRSDQEFGTNFKRKL